MPKQNNLEKEKEKLEVSYLRSKAELKSFEAFIEGFDMTHEDTRRQLIYKKSGIENNIDKTKNKLYDLEQRLRYQKTWLYKIQIKIGDKVDKTVNKIVNFIMINIL